LFFTLWRQERASNCRLKRELIEWQNKVLHQARIPLLFEPKPKPVQQIDRPPVGMMAKREYLTRNNGSNGVPSAEEILEAAERAKNP
jgi:hypothetical protein